MKINPSHDTVAVGDQYVSGYQMFKGNAWAYTSTVLAVDPVSLRFGQPDRIVTVKIVALSGNVVDASKKLWVSQLLQGLV